MYHYSVTICRNQCHKQLISVNDVFLLQSLAYANLIPSRRFLCTVSNYQSASRKKKIPKKNASSDNNYLMERNEFIVLGNDLFRNIQNAIDPIIPLNPGYKWCFSEDTIPDRSKILNENNMDKDIISITLSVGSKGNYVFEIDKTRQIFTVNSPVSGILQYYYDYSDCQWLGVQDKHDFRGLITRDLLRHSRGVCAFD